MTRASAGVRPRVRRWALARRASYLRRILAVYARPRAGPLSFWYETPELNERAFGPEVGEYYMVFRGKAAYAGPFDEGGIPLLDYRGAIGRQYNPIAIAQFGLASYNRARAGDPRGWSRFLAVADWLVDHLEVNEHGRAVWRHHFNWPYRVPLVAPWYSGLAQGQGISLLVRAARETGVPRYAAAARAAFESFAVGLAEGGVVARDEDGGLWIEEYVVDPPSHVLNGFLWSLWGVHDFARVMHDRPAEQLFEAGVQTLARNVARYDTGAWSLYELGAPRPMLASPYYHVLHVVQLRVLHRLTGRDVFARVAERWDRFASSRVLAAWALARKAWFKLWHY